MDYLRDYTRAIAKVADADGATEHSYRTPIHQMLETAAKECGVDVDILQEPGRVKDAGAPDFRISDKSGVIGYVECKPPGANLQKPPTKAQLRKYHTLSSNILLTDSWRWLLFRDDKNIGDVTLSERPDKKTQDEFSDLLRTFITTDAEKIGDAERLAAVLARRCTLLRTRLENHAGDASHLSGLLKAFRTALDPKLEFDDFADALAQTVVYSLLMAKLKAPAGEKLDLYNINRHIPGNFAVIRDITTFLHHLRESEYKDIGRVADDVLATINGMDAAAVVESMAYGKNGKGFSDADDPYIHFYENFLAVYDADQRKERGVYYTPPPVVKFIVRAVDDVLHRDFGMNNGLATNDVTVLDFAAGTGTFLLEMMRAVLADKEPAHRHTLTHDHILGHFYGFELTMAPYVIAHLKLSQFLADHGTPLEEGERINVMLTNTLEPRNEQAQLPMMPKLAEEVNRAQDVKDSPVLVVTGNPPYSGHSQNKGEWISDLIEDYKMVDGQHFNEKKHWLQDDYVKFIRFAQWKMEQVERGIVAVITNHGFLDNITFRGMRQSLLSTFDALYFLDLHGNAKKKETAPGGGKDENVFDIEQGVAVSILVKNPAVKNKGVFHADVYGVRDHKYAFCLKSNIETIDWKPLSPDSSPYMFVPRRNAPLAYKNAFPIKDIFSVSGSGIVTARDRFAIDTDRSVLLARMHLFINADKTDADIIATLKLKDTRGWKIPSARNEMAEIKDLAGCIQKIAYRPFDERWIFYHPSAVDWGREKFMHHMLAEENLGLATVRQVKFGKTWQHCLAATNLMESTFVSNKTSEIGYMFPLYLHDPNLHPHRRENLAPEFRHWIDDHYGAAHSPEAILHCIYAVLHSPDYRKRYADFLRTDFPRIPFPAENAEFLRLAAIGKGLMTAHLLRGHYTGGLAQHCGTGISHAVENVSYNEKEERLYFNKDEWFENVPLAVFNFPIGGYHPLDKYLKSRKGRTLSLEETDTLRKAANAIAFTMKKMREIDP